MKKKIIILTIFLIIISIPIIVKKVKKRNIPIIEGITIVPTTLDNITSDSSWCATFQLIWNDMKNEVVKQDIIFNPQEEMVTNLNKETFTTDMISEEYYFKIYGLKTLELKKQIEREIKAKFNQNSDILDDFSWKSQDLNETNNERYFFYTMLYREFEYPKKFEVLPNDKFGNYDNIKYFGIEQNNSTEIRKQLEVLFYNSKDDFAIKIKTKNNDEVIFYKNPQGNTFDEIYKNLTNQTQKYKGNKTFEKEDKFKAPMLDFNVKKEYQELQNKPFKTSDYKTGIIEQAIQTINFSINEKGGKIKSEAAIDIEIKAITNEPRYFYLNDTFAIFLKEQKQEKPYFIARIDNITKYQQ